MTSPAAGSPRSRSERGRLERVLGLFAEVRGGEGVQVLLLSLDLFLILTAYYLMKPVREALILAEPGGAELKSYAAAAQALLLAGVVPLYGRLARRLPRRRLINVVVGFFVLCLPAFWLLVEAEIPVAIPFYLWIGTFSLMVIAQFWSYANDIYSRDAGERLFAIIAFGGSAGAVFGSYVSTELIERLGVSSLLLGAAVVLAASVLLFDVIDARAGRDADEGAAGTASEEPIGDGNPFAIVLRDRYLLSIALLMLLLNWVNTTGEYVLGRIVSDAAADAVANGTAAAGQEGAFIGAFYAQFFGVVNATGMVLQLFVVSRLITHLGVPLAVLVLPLVSLGSYAAVAAVPMLALVRWVKTAENSIDYSLQATVRHVLFLPTTRREKYMAKQAIDTFFVRAGDVLSAVTVYVGTAVFALGVSRFALVNVCLVAVWLLVSVAVGRGFVRRSAARPTVAAGIALLVLVSVCAPARATERTGDEHVRVPASLRYERSKARRMLFGEGYRELWKTPIEVGVLDLDSEGGGLTPTRRFGGQQTAVLGFTGEDGRSYSFRSVDKDPAAVLDPLLWDTFVRDVVQDQMAAQHPGGFLPANVVLRAAGVPCPDERFVVMPDSPRLGEFRKEFAGMLGTFYEFPQPASDGRPGFEGATAIIDHEELYDRLARGWKDRVDARAFLRVRLVDILIGDFDRHRKQWRWAKMPGDDRWKPVPEDRDMAFVRYEGALPRIAHLYVPILQRYGPEYPSIKGLTLHGWEQDRWLLAELGWDDWRAVAKDVQSRVTDAVIDGAVAVLPPDYAAIDGERLRHDLRGRRDRLVEGARSFYEHLAHEVEVQATDQAERVRVTRERGGMEIAVYEARSAAAEPVFHRRFDADETQEVRIHLRGGDDHVDVRGGAKPIRLRVIGGSGAGVVDDRQAGGTRVYDEAGTYRVVPGRRTHIDRNPYVPPTDTAGFVDVEDVPPRDWGSDLFPMPRIGYERDVGLFIGAAAVYTRYGFRKDPWSSRHVVGFGWATEASEPRAEYTGTWRRENTDVLGELQLLASGIEVLRFYGFGNETDDRGTDRQFRVRNQQFRLAPRLKLPLLDDMIRVSAGPWMDYSRTVSGDRLIDRLEPYGSGGFGSLGALLNVQLDTRRSLSDDDLRLALPLHPDNVAAGYPLRGVLVDVTAGVSPPVWDTEETWGWLEGSVAGYLTGGPQQRVTLGARVGGRQTWGRYPYFGAAFVGGGEMESTETTLRGYRAQRYAGDSSVFGNLDVRIFVARVKLLLPGDFGVLGFGDVGRVFFDDEDSGKWHPGWGGGVWFAPLARTNSFSLSVAGSPEDTLVYLRNGFHF